MLIVTNGSSVTERLREDRFPATLLSWMDMLYEGPVVAGVDLAGLSEIRSFYLALEGYGYLDEISSDFRRRDEAMARWREHDELVLFFEHDLHDQLELIQVLDYLASQPGLPTTKVTMAVIHAFPGLDERFIGLGQLTASQMRDVLATRQPVTPDQMVVARKAWNALVQPNPLALQALLQDDLRPLPYLKPAIQRLLQELPQARTGVSRTEWQILRVLAAGPRARVDLYFRTQELEDAPFQGDSPIYRALRQLASAAKPAVKIDGETCSLTEFGRRLLAGEGDWTKSLPLNRWLGGTHLKLDGGNWRWDTEKELAVQLPDVPGAPVFGPLG